MNRKLLNVLMNSTQIFLLTAGFIVILYFSSILYTSNSQYNSQEFLASYFILLLTLIYQILDSLLYTKLPNP
ncbi:MAG: hypothetical protein KJ592_05080 [Nanoarchaeota archaeon]|nr:hypothetical protein [Nanoarchaeota archaeon]